MVGIKAAGCGSEGKGGGTEDEGEEERSERGQETPEGEGGLALGGDEAALCAHVRERILADSLRTWLTAAARGRASRRYVACSLGVIDTRRRLPPAWPRALAT